MPRPSLRAAQLRPSSQAESCSVGVEFPQDLVGVPGRKHVVDGVAPNEQVDRSGIVVLQRIVSAVRLVLAVVQHEQARWADWEVHHRVGVAKATELKSWV